MSLYEFAQYIREKLLSLRVYLLLAVNYSPQKKIRSSRFEGTLGGQQKIWFNDQSSDWPWEYWAQNLINLQNLHVRYVMFVFLCSKCIWLSEICSWLSSRFRHVTKQNCFFLPSYQAWSIPTWLRSRLDTSTLKPDVSLNLQLAYECEDLIYTFIYMYIHIHFPKMSMEPKNGLLEESE